MSADPTTSAPPPRRWPRRLLYCVGLSLLVLIALVGGGYLYVTSKAGSERLARLGLSAVNATISGKVEVRSFELARSGLLVIEGLTLHDPEGNLVAEVARVEASVRLADLLGRKLQLDSARVSAPRLYLVEDSRGLNLSRALAAKTATGTTTAPSEEKGAPLTIALDAFTLEQGYVDLVRPSDRFTLEALTLSGDARYGPGAKSFKAKVILQGRSTRPVQGPVTLRGEVTGEADALAGQVALAALGAVLEGSGNVKGTEGASLKIDVLELPPESAKAFLPMYPLKVPISAKGEVSQSGNVVAAKLSGRAGKATVELDGSWDLVRWHSAGIFIKARGVDLDELLHRRSVDTQLSLDLVARGGGSRLSNLDASVELDVSASKIDGHPFGPVRVSASAAEGRISLRELTAVLPGVDVAASGSGTRNSLALSGRLRATDLAALTHTLRSFLPGVPSIVGKGKIDFSVQGPLAHPALAAKGSLAQLRLGDNAVSGLLIDARLADIRRPLEAEGTLSAQTLRLGTRSFHQLVARLSTRGRSLEADLSAKGLADFVVHVGGTLDADSQGLLLTALSVSYPEAQWSLHAPAHLSLFEGGFLLEPLALSAGKQRLRLGGSKRGSRVEASLDLEALELKALPGGLVPASLRLGGALGLKARATGRLPQPELAVEARWSEGTLREVTGIDVRLDGRYRSERAVGTVAANSTIAALEGNFDLPVAALLEGRDEPLTGGFKLSQVRLEQALPALGLTSVPASGAVSAELTLSGSSIEPRALLAATGIKVRLQLPSGAALEAEEVRLHTRTNDLGHLGATLELRRVLEGRAVLTVQTPLSLSGLIEERPDREALRAMTGSAELEVTGIDLASASEQGLLPPESGGNASLMARLQGGFRGVTGQAEAKIIGARTPRLTASNLVVTASLAEEEVRLTARADRGAQSLLDLNARVGAPASAAWTRTTFDDLALGLDGEAGPLMLSELTAGDALTDAEQARQVNGRIRVSAQVGGTLSRPTLALRSAMDQLGLGKVALGTAELAYDYGAGENRLSVKATSTSGGRLRLAGNARLDLSYPALRKGLAYRKAPFNATLKADQFDVAFLSGLHPRIRAVAGLLKADAIASGTVATPELSGSVEWIDGRIGLLGLGEYRQAHVLLVGSREKIELKDLRAQSGGGAARFSGEAVRTPEGYSLTARGDTTQFPIVFDDQLMATATLRTHLVGELSAERIDIRRLSVPEAHFQLPEVKRKDLQGLDRPDDIVLFKDGEPLDPRRKKRQKAAAAELARGSAAPPAEARGRQLWVVVDAPRNLWVKGDDVNAELGLSEGFRVVLADKLTINGEVRALRARAEVLGRKFVVQRDSQVRFQGPANSPYLNITAVHENEREAVTVFVTITGRGKDFVLKPSSQPPLPESDIYTLLATGRRTLKRGTGASLTGAQSASVVIAYLTSQAKKLVAQKVPLDVVSIEAGDEGFAGARLELGKYLNESLYLGYAGQYGADATKGQNSHEVRLEYQISPRVSLEGKYGNANAGGVDLIWSKDY